MLINPRKRLLTDAASSSSLIASSPSSSRDITQPLPFHSFKRFKSAYDPTSNLHQAIQNECARLGTIDPKWGKRVLIVQLDQPFFIGRSESNDYTILNDPTVSNRHCRLYSLTSDTGEIHVCLEDVSTNGTMHNDRKVNKGTVVLNTGDRIEIGSQIFRFYQRSVDPTSIANSQPLSTTQALRTALMATNVQSERVGDYFLSSRALGSGAFAIVLLAYNTKTLKQVACKKMLKSIIGTKNLNSIQREVEMLKKTSHPNINKIQDVKISNDAVYIFLDLVSGGDLFTFLVKRGRLDAPQAKWIFYQLLQALRYLHEQTNIAHRDIKLENVIRCSSGSFPKVQLADFGQATISNRRFRSLKGTLQYMSPEQLTGWTRREGYDGKIADMWSSGILLSFLLTGGHPFEPNSPHSSSSSSSISSSSKSPASAKSIFGPTASEELKENVVEMKLCKNVVRGDVGLPRFKFGSHDSAVRTLLSCLLNPEPKTRISARLALEDKWIKASEGELKELYKRIVIEN